MGETHRKFDRDFRDGAVRIVRETGKPVAQVAQVAELAMERDAVRGGLPRARVSQSWFYKWKDGVLPPRIIWCPDGLPEP